MGRQRNTPPIERKGGILRKSAKRRQVNYQILNSKQWLQGRSLCFLITIGENYQKLHGNYKELSSNYIRVKNNIETIDKSQEEMKNTISELKNTLEGIKNRQDEVDDQVSKQE